MAGPTPAPGALLDIGNRLLECASAALAETEAGAPGFSYMIPGADLAWDYCMCPDGQLTVHIRTSYPSASPELVQLLTTDTCGAPWTVVEYVVTVLRCVPTQEDDGHPPPPAAMTAAAEVDWADREAVLRAVKCCQLDDGDTRRLHPSMIVQEQLGVGNDGGCAGSELHVLVGIPNCGEC